MDQKEEAQRPHSRLTRVIISLGSNYGDRLRAVQDAVDWLETVLEACCHSDIYETESISGDGKMYLNCVMAGVCRLDAEELALQCKKYELRAGRDEACRHAGQVPIDIDVVYFDNAAIRPREASAEYFLKGLARLPKPKTDEK